MCGIVGLAGDLNVQSKDIFRNLLTVCQLRGEDSTGAIKVGLDNKADWCKDTGLPHRLLDTRTYEKRIEAGLAKAYIGHCRARTFGAIKAANAHPFEHDHLVGVHNGTLRGWHAKPKARDFEVDSDWLYATIAENGIEDTINDLDDAGAWALVWFDERDGTLNFLRNKERTLFFTWNKAKTQMFWASEAWMLHVVGRKIELWEPDDPGVPVFFPLPADELWSFKIGSSVNKDGIFNMSPIKEVKGNAVPFTYIPPHQRAGGSGTDLQRVGNNAGGVDNRVNNPFAGSPAWKDDDVPAYLLPAPTLPASTKNQDGSGTSKPVEPLPKAVSSKVLDFRAALKNSKNGKKPTLSLPSTNTNSSTPANKNGSCGDSIVRFPGSASNGVSFRDVLGTKYISDFSNGFECVLEELLDNSHATCFFCKTPIGDESEIGRVLDNSRFVCDDCLTEPKIELSKEKKRS